MTQAYNLSQLANNLDSSGRLDATDGLVNAVSVANGGTGADNATSARSNLGLGSLATQNTINNDNWSGTDLSVPNGGTGVSSITGVVYGNGTSAMTAATEAQIVAAIGNTAVANATNAVTAQNVPGISSSQIAKAWVSFFLSSTSPTINVSYNVSSVTFISASSFNINFPSGVFTDTQYLTFGSNVASPWNGYNQASSVRENSKQYTKSPTTCPVSYYDTFGGNSLPGTVNAINAYLVFFR